jgi:DNA-binding NarL/FixJ family response regulator
VTGGGGVDHTASACASRAGQDDVRRSVVVADGRPEVRARRVDALRAAGFCVVGEATDVREAGALARRRSPQLLVLDSRLPGDPVALVRELRDGRLAECVVVGRSRDGCEALAFAVAGAAGYVHEDEPWQHLAAAAYRVAVGEAALPAPLVRQLIEDLRRRDHEEAFHHCEALAALTPRQWEVLELMRQGLSTQQMARRLVVAPVTVRTHVARILHVLKARDRVEALEKLDALLASTPDRAGHVARPAGTPPLRSVNGVDGSQHSPVL